MKTKVLLALVAVHAVSLSAVTNDLVITSITRQNDCTTLTWISHPGEFYTVYWTDSLNPPIFWRVAEVNVPSQGTNTIWSEGGCSQMLVAGGGVSESSSSAPAESEGTVEKADPKPSGPMVMPKDEKSPPLPLGIYPPGFDLSGSIIIWADGVTEEWSKEVVEKWRESQRQNEPATDGDDDGGLQVEARFYRVARTAVAGVVDGWGSPAIEIPVGLTNVFGVSCGFAHNLALRSDGSVVAWGTNQFGQCNVPTNVADVVAVAAGAYHSVAVQRDGSAAVWGDNTYGQVTNKPANLTNVVDVKAGYYHTLALKSDGTVAAWGGGYPLTNAVPAGLSNVTAIAAFGYHCMALKLDRTVAAWGFSPFPFVDFMPTNLPASWSNVVGIAAGRYHNLAVRNDGSVLGYGFPPGASIPSGLSNVVAVGAGYDSD
ncbi:MAG: hypothetical protein QHJ82_07255 [Verrucomicrobiota bacterium]|nr:hypothetical protein [Verrucomicrobiota bacterium]